MHINSPGRMLPWVTALLSITGLSAANAQMATRATPRAVHAALSDSVDRQVVFTLIKADRDEVAISRTALPSLQDTEAKAFAQRMIDDHGANLTAISTTGSRLGYTPPVDPAPAGNLAGTTDAQYIAGQVTAHRQLLSQLPTEPAVVKDPGLRQQLTDTRRAVQMHLEDAVRLQGRLNGKMP